MPWLQPWHQIAARLVYAARGLDVRDVWIDGVRQVANGRHLAIDTEEAIAKAAEWGRQFSRSDAPQG